MICSLSLSRSPSSISCPSFEELLCPSAVSVLWFLSIFFFEGGNFTAILNFCSRNFITRAPYASSGRDKAYMGLCVTSNVALEFFLFYLIQWFSFW